MSSYEDNCRDYALHGNPMRDAMDYEENARYDRWDGYHSLCTAGYYDHNDGDMEPEPQGSESEPTPEPSEPSETLSDDVPF